MKIVNFLSFLIVFCFKISLCSRFLKASKRHRNNFMTETETDSGARSLSSVNKVKASQTPPSSTPTPQSPKLAPDKSTNSSGNSSNLTKLSSTFYTDLNKTFVVQNLNDFKTPRKHLDFKLLDKQIETIFQGMLYAQQTRVTPFGLRGYIQFFMSGFEACDNDNNNVLSFSEFSTCMQNDTYLKQILIPEKRFAAQANFTNSSYFYQILFDLFDEYHNNYLNFKDYMKLRLMIFSWKHCSLANSYIEETLFECAFEVSSGFKTLNRRTAKNIFNLGLYLSNNEVIRNLDFISYCMLSVSANLYGYINGKDDGDIDRSELELALDNNMLPLRYNQFTIDAIFWLTKDKGKINQGIDVKTFVFYDYMLRLFDLKNVSRPYYLNSTEFASVLNNSFFPNKTLSEISAIPPYDITTASFQMFAYLNISQFMKEDDYLLNFLEVQHKKRNKASNYLSTYNYRNIMQNEFLQNTTTNSNGSNSSGIAPNLTKTANLLFKVLDFDSDGYISFQEFGCLVQLSFIMSKIDKTRIGMVPAGVLYDYLYNYDDFPKISFILKERINRLSTVPEDLYINLYSLVLLLKIDENVEMFSRKSGLSTLYEVELKTVLAKVGLRYFPEPLLNKCLRGTDNDYIPKYDWECAVIQGVISISKYYQAVRFYTMGKQNNVTLLNTVFYNVDPQVI